MKPDVTTPLWERMRAKVEAEGLPADHALRTFADALEAATLGYFSEPQTCSVEKFLGCWARARRTWCSYTGESLVT